MKQPPQQMAGASESPWTMTSCTMLKLVIQVGTCCTLSDKLVSFLSFLYLHTKNSDCLLLLICLPKKVTLVRYKVSIHV